MNYTVPITPNQQVMERLFPKKENRTPNSITSAVTRYDDPQEPVAVSFLIMADDYTLKEFGKEAPGGSVDVEIAVSSDQHNNDEANQDLIIEFSFIYPTGQPTFRVTIPGNDMAFQREYCKALLAVDKFYFFIATNDFRLVKVKEIAWNPMPHKYIYDILERQELVRDS